MKTKFMLIISIFLFVVAVVLLWKDASSTIGIVLLMISVILNGIRGFIILWNNRRLK